LFDAGTPKPTPPDTAALSLLHRVWNNKELLPRVKTFAWRAASNALATEGNKLRRKMHVKVYAGYVARPWRMRRTLCALMLVVFGIR
jgi:hypothetical protein